MTITVFGNDILEEGGYIVRPLDAGAFAFGTPQKRRILVFHWVMNFNL